mgnify:CR=1 FL=1
METVTITKKAYKSLTEKAMRYDFLRMVMEKDLFSPPPKNASKVITEFRKSGLYNEQFITSPANGIKRSAYFNKK